MSIDPEQQVEQHLRSQPKPWAQVGQWVVAFTPPLFVTVLGVTLFYDLIVRSIHAAADPAIVYGILSAFFLGVFLCAQALYRFQSESRYVGRWEARMLAERRDDFALEGRRGRQRIAFPALATLSLKLPSVERQARFELEVKAADMALSEKLSLANYIAGALIGLGLVGTFVGLLGTLEDLGAVFGSLAQTGNSEVNPSAVFSSMVQKLQDPMRSMGTAFVTSLYGLLGSLIIGLCSLSVAKAANSVIKGLHAASRLHGTLFAERDRPARGSAEDSLTVYHLKNLVANMLEAQTHRDKHLQDWLQNSEDRMFKLLDQMLEANWSSTNELIDRSQSASQELAEVLRSYSENSLEIARRLKDQDGTLLQTIEQMAQQMASDQAFLRDEVIAKLQSVQSESQRGLGAATQLIHQVAGSTEHVSELLERHISQQQAKDKAAAVAASAASAYSSASRAAQRPPRRDFASFFRRGAQDPAPQDPVESRTEPDLTVLSQSLERQSSLLQELLKRDRGHPSERRDREAHSDH